MPRQLHDRDLVELVLHDVQLVVPALQPVTVRQGGAAEVNGDGVASPGIDPEQQAGVGLDGHQRVPGLGDPVEVEAVDVFEVACQGQRSRGARALARWPCLRKGMTPSSWFMESVT